MIIALGKPGGMDSLVMPITSVIRIPNAMVSNTGLTRDFSPEASLMSVSATFSTGASLKSSSLSGFGSLDTLVCFSATL